MFGPDFAFGYKYDVAAFERYLKEKGFFSSLDEAVKFQDSATGKDRYKIVDYLIEHVKEKGGTFNGMKVRYTNLRSYFLHKGAELPRVHTTFTPTRDATVARLDVSSLKILIREAGLKHGAIILTLFQSLMDQERFFSHFNRLGYELTSHLKEKGVDVPFRVEFLRGRRTNPRPFNSWLGRDSLQAWKDYFDRERSWPTKRGDAVALNIHGKP